MAQSALPMGRISVSKPAWRRLWKVALGVVAAGLAFVAIVGFAHTKHGRFLLAYLPGMGARCPVGMDQKLSPVERDASRSLALQTVRGDGQSPSRSVDGLELGQASTSDALAHETARGLSCEENATKSELRCLSSDKTSSALYLVNRDGKVVSLQRQVTLTDAGEAVSRFEQRSATLRQSLGAPTKSHGDATAVYLTGAALRQINAEHRFSDFRALVRATNVARGRFDVTESYSVIEAAPGQD